MSVQHTIRRERLRHADGTVDLLPGPDLLGLSAIASVASGLHPISGAARAAVRSGSIEPYVAAAACFRSTRTMPSYDIDGYGMAIVPASVGYGTRQNPVWEPLILDVSELDSGATLPPESRGSDHEDAYYDGTPTLYTDAAQIPLVPNPSADAAGATWIAGGGGSYSQAATPSLDGAGGLPGDRAHVVTWAGEGAGVELVTPDVTCSYRHIPGRPFTLTLWADASTPVEVSAVIEFEDAAGTLLEGPTVSTVRIDGVGRHVMTMALNPSLTVHDSWYPYYPTGAMAPLPTARLRIVVVSTGGVSGSLAVRGAFAYAGADDRGDEAGSWAIPVSEEVAIYATDDHRFGINRVDVHGVSGIGSPTSAWLVQAQGESKGHGYGSSPGPRVTVRSEVVGSPQPPSVAFPGDLLFFALVYIEEASARMSSGVWGITSVEAMLEIDLSDRIVELSVERSTDADPADSTVPIGNYTATHGRLKIDNADRGMSPFAASYIGDPSRVDTCVGVVITNRHNDPAGEALDPSAWVGDIVPIVDDGQVRPPGDGMVVAGVGSPVSAVADLGGLGRSCVASAWVTGGDAGCDVAVVDLDTGSTISTTALAAGATWQYVELSGAATRHVAVRVTGSGARLAAPTITALQGGEVVEVLEVGPAGVFRSVDWPMSTSSDTIDVQLVDVLASSGDGALDSTVRVDWPIAWSLRDVMRRYLDLGSDQVVVDPGTVVLPYTIAAPTVGQHLADLAKAAAMTLYTDGAGRAVAQVRQAVEVEIAARYREDSALISAAVPLSPDIVRNDVTITGHPIVASAQTVAVLGNPTAPDPGYPWAPSGVEAIVPVGETVELILPYSTDAALDVTLATLRVFVSDQIGVTGPLDIASNPLSLLPGTTLSGWSLMEATLEAYTTFAILTITSKVFYGTAGDLVVDFVELAGTGLVASDLTQRYTSADSIRFYGRRSVELDVRLGSSAALLKAVGQDVLANFALRDSTGERWLPDLEVETLGDPWRELGDRVLAREARSGIGGEYRVVSHGLTVGRAMRSSMYLRRVPTGQKFLVLDRDALDSGAVLSY